MQIRRNADPLSPRKSVLQRISQTRHHQLPIRGQAHKNIELEARHELAEDATRMWVATAIDEDFDLLYDMTQILKLSDLR